MLSSVNYLFNIGVRENTPKKNWKINKTRDSLNNRDRPIKWLVFSIKYIGVFLFPGEIM